MSWPSPNAAASACHAMLQNSKYTTSKESPIVVVVMLLLNSSLQKKSDIRFPLIFLLNKKNQHTQPFRHLVSVFFQIRLTSLCWYYYFDGILVQLTLNIFLISSFTVVENDEAVRLCQILQTKVNWTIRLGAPPQRGRPRLSCQSVQQPWCWWTWAMHNWQQPRQLQQPLPHHPHPQPPKNNISNEWCNFCNTIHKIVHKVCLHF